MTDLETRIAEAKALQVKPATKPAPTPRNARQRAMYATFQRIDHKHDKPKIQYFPQEKRYCFPANCGNARNPLVFGKIPLEYQIREIIENERVMHSNGLRNTNKTKWMQRVKSMKFR